MRDPFPPGESDPLTIIGLGSPFGDDRVGWRVAEALKDRISKRRVRIVSLDRPGPALLDEIAGRAEAILIDGAATGLAPGTVRRIGAAAILAAPDSGSSRGLGVAHALQLGRALGILPERLTLYLVSLDPAATTDPDAALTPAVEAAALAVTDKIQQRLSG